MKLFQLLLLVFIMACSSSWEDLGSSRPKSNFKFSVLQGTTDSKSTVLRIVFPNFLRPIYKITKKNGDPIRIKNIREFKRKSYEFIVAHIFLDGLSLDEEYHLNISTQLGKWKDERTFKTLDPKGFKTKILMASCMSDTYNDIGNVIWEKALEHKPDLLFFTGDNIYADIYSGIYIGAKIPSTVDHLWRRHIDHAMTMKVYRAKRLVPSLAIWDDHDYGVNNGDGSYKNKIKSLEIFQTFFPLYENEYVKKGLGVGSSFKFREQNYLFLDARSFRDSEENKKGYHFGVKQRNWLHKNLQDSKNLNWLIAGDQFFGGYHPFESFEGVHPVEFKKFKNELKDLGKKYLFISINLWR